MKSMAAAEQKTPQAFLDELAPLHTGALWMRLNEALQREPVNRAAPHVWRYEEVRPQLMRAGDLLTAEEAERRVIMLLNPGLGNEIAATETLYAGLQLILPGEIAPTHRHSPSALRFIVEGTGAYTAVNGERLTMHPGDLILNANWTWHDHGNETDTPTVWLDGLDLPLVSKLGAVFADPYPNGVHPVVKPNDTCLAMYGAGGLAPRGETHTERHSPLAAYPWERARAALEHPGAAAAPADGVIFEYTNPLDGGPPIPTMACYVQMLRPGEHTRSHRHMSSLVYHVIEGAGYSMIGETRLDWTTHDTFAQPGWMWHEHVNTSKTEPAFLFSYSDRPVLEYCGLYREEER